MTNPFYAIWADCIARMRSVTKGGDDWAKKSLFFMTTAMAFNILLFVLLLQIVIPGKFNFVLSMQFLPKQLNYFLSFVVLYCLPCLLMNYLIVFRKSRYVFVLKEYPYKNGKLFAIYYALSVSLPTLLILLFF